MAERQTKPNGFVCSFLCPSSIFPTREIFSAVQPPITSSVQQTFANHQKWRLFLETLSLQDPLIRRMKGSMVVKNEPNKLLYSELPRDYRGRFHTDPKRGNAKPVSAVQTVYSSLSTRVQSEAKRIDVMSRYILGTVQK